MPGGLDFARLTLAGTLLPLLMMFGGLFSATPAEAWGEKGHRIVCTVAWDELSDDTRNRLKQIMNLTDRDQFAARCVAPASEAAWHRMYVSPDARSVDLARDCPRPPSCALREIDRTLGIIGGIAPDEEKALAVATLGHLVADIHHPLSLGFASDNGGADIPAIFNGKNTTLREIWDEHLLAGIPDIHVPQSRVRIYGALFRIGGRSETWTKNGPEAWANESLWIMRTPATGYVGNPGNLDFGDLYVKQNELIAFEQIDKAAVRLGYLLEQIFK